MTSPIQNSRSRTEGDTEVSESNRDTFLQEERSSSPIEEDDMAPEKGNTCADEEILIPPSVPKNGISILAHKLWIGNLDKRMSGQTILRFLVKYGTIVSFRYLFRTGPERSETRDYVFVEFSSREEAEKAKENLDGKKALGKKIIVDWARQDQGAARNPNAVSETWDISSVSETLGKKVSTSAKIAALEAKLKQMEEAPSNPFPAKRSKFSSVQHLRKPLLPSVGGYSRVNLKYHPSRHTRLQCRSKIAHRTS